MDGTGPQHPLNDSQLERELESALGIEPSPAFLARVRTRIAAEPEPSAWRLSFEPLAAVAIVGIVMAIVMPQFMRQETARPDVGVPRVADVVPPPVETALARQPANAQARQRAVTEVRAESPRTLPLQLSPVLFADDDQRAFALFVAAVGEGRVLEEAIRGSDESRVETALSIEPLVIAPLPPLARAAQEGEDQWE